MFIRNEEVKKLLEAKKEDIEIIKEFIAKGNLESYEYNKKIELNNNVFFRKLKYNLKEKRTFKLENHQQMIDVHYSLKGSEKMFVAHTKELELTTPYNEENDVEWYSLKDNSNVVELIIPQGEMFIAAPSEAHEPDNIVNELEHEKIIFKIKI